MTVQFEAPGTVNTDATVQCVLDRLERGGIEHVVVATTTGDTGVRFMEALKDTSAQLICVTHHMGFREPNQIELEPMLASQLREGGARVLTMTHALSGVGRSISKKFGGISTPELIASTLRLFGQGMKVCVEIAVMAADTGAVPAGRDVICVGGSGRGADAAVVLRPAHMNAFFDLKIRELLCWPKLP
ncbi:pyruvate kinase alpha/beta domain-containing protein [Candidatus Bipolaricaulota bacterium]